MKMTDYKIEPPAPKIALGIIKTGDEVQLKVEMSERLKVACRFEETTRKVTTEDGRDVTPLTYGSKV